MQDLGRTHRTAQGIPPHYILLSLNVDARNASRRPSRGGSNNSAAFLPRRRKAGGGGTDFSKYNFESRYGRLAVDH